MIDVGRPSALFVAWAVGVALIVLLAGLVSHVAGTALDLVRDTHYPTHADAVADGAITRGWVPPWVPAVAFDLREVHDLDNSQQVLAFALPPGARFRMPPGCVAVANARPPARQLSRPWWPSNATIAQSYVPHACGERHVIAVRRDGARVLHWSPRP